jgi:hypothetical protein
VKWWETLVRLVTRRESRQDAATAANPKIVELRQRQHRLINRLQGQELRDEWSRLQRDAWLNDGGRSEGHA